MATEWPAMIAALAVFVTATASQPTPSPRERSRDDTSALVVKDLAAMLNVAADRITVVEAAERTWPDEGLGCARKGLREPSPVQGFVFRLAAGDREYEYHSDRLGRFCRVSDNRKQKGQP